MSETATLTITSGPDRGKRFALREELVHVGHGPMNQVNLADAGVADHQASIVRRNGRFAIYTPLQQGVEVDGSHIPSERWVWLPNRATIKLSETTSLQFEAPPPENGQENRSEARSSAGDKPFAGLAGDRRDSSSRSQETSEGGQPKQTTAPPKRAGKSSPGRRSKKTGRQVARFITDRAGESRVTLGEDGHLPELSLAEAAQRKSAANRKTQSSPMLLYAVVTTSLCLSLAMLFIDVEPSGTSTADKAAARQAIAEFYGDEGEEPALYQRYLREAQLAHSRGDPEAERRAYRRVLDLLNSEDNQNRYANTEQGYLGIVTGTPTDDERLRELISVLLR